MGLGVVELGAGVVTAGEDVVGVGSGVDVQPATSATAASSAPDHTAYRRQVLGGGD